MKTPLIKKEDINPKWHLVDADGKTLGRLATRVAILLRGKNKPIYAPHQDTGDFVVVINAKRYSSPGKNGRKKSTPTTPVIPAG